jgi:hypothetical protein
MNVYIDESGDLGWTLDKPYQRGGSSKFITISHLILPKELKHIPKRLVRDLYDHMSWPTDKELKASNLKPRHREFFAKKVASMLMSHRRIKVVAITAYKENAMRGFRRDPNKLYNYMIRLALLDHIKTFPNVAFITDKRTIKVESGNSLADYLQITLMTEYNSETVLRDLPFDSKNSLNVQFADFMANFVWRSFELGDRKAMSILSRHIISKSLYPTRS